jgi:hypothetical protein
MRKCVSIIYADDSSMGLNLRGWVMGNSATAWQVTREVSRSSDELPGQIARAQPLVYAVSLGFPFRFVHRRSPSQMFLALFLSQP